MADKKISQLTGATTPLAGTEVLPIVQSATTVKVATDDLTVKNVRSNATSGILQIAGPAAAATRTMTVPDANFTAARTDAANSFTGNQTLANENLVVGTAAKGIDFSANTHAAGMTSELLNWYEEGAWTPVLTFGTPGDLAVTYSAQVGRYTRIGRQVTVIACISTSAFTHTTASGNLNITGLPFTSANVANLLSNGTVSASGWTKTCEWITPQLGNNSATIYFQASTSGSTVTNVTTADVPTGTQQIWRVGLTYIV